MKLWNTILLCISLWFGTTHTSATAKLHDFHVSITVAEINPKNGNLEGYIKLFSDDIYAALAKNEGKSIQAYLASRLFFTVENQKKPIHYIGREEENGLVYVYFEIKDFPANGNIGAQNTVLFDMFDDQSNIVNLSISGINKSVFLNVNKQKDTFK